MHISWGVLYVDSWSMFVLCLSHSECMDHISWVKITFLLSFVTWTLVTPNCRKTKPSKTFGIFYGIYSGRYECVSSFFVWNTPNEIVSMAREWDYYLIPGISCDGILLPQAYPWISRVISRERLSYYTIVKLEYVDQSKVNFPTYQDYIVKYGMCNHSNDQIYKSISWSCV